MLRITITKTNNLAMISPFLFGVTNNDHCDYQQRQTDTTCSDSGHKGDRIWIERKTSGR